MTGAPTLAFPGSRKLAGWWRQLAPLQPHSLWVAHLLLHRVEAFIHCTHPAALDPFAVFLLRGLALADHAWPDDVAGSLSPLRRMDERMRIGMPVLRQGLRDLEGKELVERRGVEHWAITPRGREALEQGSYLRNLSERRTFFFVDGRGNERDLESRLHFLDVHDVSGVSWPSAEGVEFDGRALQDCIGRPTEWKREHRFPEDVQELVLSGRPGQAIRGDERAPSAEQWRGIMVDRPQQMLALLVLATTPEGDEQLLGLAIRQDGWMLQTAAPLFTIGPRWREVFPDLCENGSVALWRHAWRSWCEQRGLPPSEVEQCVLEVKGAKLRVIAPASLLELLRATRSDALRGEAWLVGGAGRIAPVANVELVGVEPRAE